MRKDWHMRKIASRPDDTEQAQDDAREAGPGTQSQHVGAEHDEAYGGDLRHAPLWHWIPREPIATEEQIEPGATQVHDVLAEVYGADAQAEASEDIARPAVRAESQGA